jgi:transcriptional regulator
MSTETLTYLEKRELEIKQEKQKLLQNIDHIESALRTEIEKLGLILEKTDRNRFGEKTEHAEMKLVITHPELKMFRAEILGREWADRNRAVFNVDWCFTEVVKLGETFSDDGARFKHKQHNFVYALTNEEQKSLGISDKNYSGTLSELGVIFKAMKSAKLIQRDILPKLKIYSKVVSLAEPRILARIKKDTETLEMINKIAKLLNESPSYELTPREFNLSEENTLLIDRYGDIQLKIVTAINPKTALELVEQVKKEAI